MSERNTFVIGICGSVAVGKSSLSLELKSLLSRWPEHPSIEIVSTDSFLFPTHTLKDRGLMHKKGFPESYDLLALQAFLQNVHSQAPILEAPIYSHAIYDIINEVHAFPKPDILILEGVNILQQVPEYLDFSIYIDAPIESIKTWYLERFKNLLNNAKSQPDYYLHAYTQMPPEEAVAKAEHVWNTVNELNLIQHILPYKDKADVILEKDEQHAINTEQYALMLTLLRERMHHTMVGS